MQLQQWKKNSQRRSAAIPVKFYWDQTQGALTLVSETSYIELQFENEAEVKELLSNTHQVFHYYQEPANATS